MHYSVYFFALDANKVAKQMASESKEILERVQELVREQRDDPEGDLPDLLSRATAICQGKLPNDCDEDYFDALCWLLEAAAEKIHIPSFIDFKHMSYLKEIGIWPWLLENAPPFPAPSCREPPPQVGFLPTAKITSFALPAIDKLPEASIPEVSYARQEFQEVAESVAEDGLDLLAVLI